MFEYIYYTIIQYNKITKRLNKEKDDFYQVIKSFNILAIINGHIHTPKRREGKGFTVLNGGGSKLIRMNMENDKYINCDFI